MHVQIWGWHKGRWFLFFASSRPTDRETEKVVKFNKKKCLCPIKRGNVLTSQRDWKIDN